MTKDLEKNSLLLKHVAPLLWFLRSLGQGLLLLSQLSESWSLLVLFATGLRSVVVETMRTLHIAQVC